MVRLSLGIPLGYPLESPNPGAVIGYLFESLTVMIIDISIVNPHVYMIGYMCYTVVLFFALALFNSFDT